MKATAVIGYICAVLSLLGGFILSLNQEFNTTQGLIALFSGVIAAILFALPSTALLGIVQIRTMLRKREEVE
jgi:hypothetical protein